MRPKPTETADNARKTDQIVAAVYTRISADRTGEAAGVAREEEDCRAIVDREGWTLHQVYVDNDRSVRS